MRFLPHHAALIAGFSRANDTIVPVICPTCQMLRKWARHCAGRCRLLCMGLFSIFLLGGPERALLMRATSEPSLPLLRLHLFRERPQRLRHVVETLLPFCAAHESENGGVAG